MNYRINMNYRIKMMDGETIIISEKQFNRIIDEITDCPTGVIFLVEQKSLINRSSISSISPAISII